MAEENKELLKLAKLDQIVECFPNTLLKMLPGEISKTKWSKKAKEVLSWEDWWEMHEKVSLFARQSFLEKRKHFNNLQH